MTAPPPALHTRFSFSANGTSDAVVASITIAQSGSTVNAAVLEPLSPTSSCTTKLKYISYSSSLFISSVKTRQPKRSSIAFDIILPSLFSYGESKAIISPKETYFSASSLSFAPISMHSEEIGGYFFFSSALRR